MAPGFLSRLLGAGESVTPSAPSQLVPIGAGWPDVEVAGESHHRDAIASVFHSLGRPEGGVTMQTAWLVPEPSNRYDRNAVRVLILGQHVGYVPAELSATIAKTCASLARGNVATAPARIWAIVDDGTWRSRVTLTFAGTTEDEKDYAADRRQAEATQAAREAERNRKAAERDAKEHLKEARREAGIVQGQYWVLWKPTISELKRQARFEEAKALLLECIDAAERESSVAGQIPDSWPSEQMSVVLRRMKDFNAELAILNRYVAACGVEPIPESVTARLNRALIAEPPTDGP